LLDGEAARCELGAVSTVQARAPTAQRGRKKNTRIRSATPAPTPAITHLLEPFGPRSWLTLTRRFHQLAH
jgi:hypothetical protein